MNDSLINQSSIYVKDHQLSIFKEDIPLTQESFRPIHYLGSKLRILDFIENTINKIDPDGGSVCDLFAGSGTVSKHLSKTRSVTAVDIQEYSRVICSALLNPIDGNYQVQDFIEQCKNADHFKKLYRAIEPMIEYETKCIRNASHGDLIPLCELVESGSIISFEQGIISSCSAELIDALRSTNSRLIALDFISGPEALVVRYFGGLYFSYLQAMQIDSLLEQIHKLSKEVQDTFLAATLSTASEIVNTVGKQFAQPIKPRKSDGTPKKNIINRIQKDRNDNVFEVFGKWLERYLSQEKANYNHYIYKMDYSDALDIIKNDIKVVYADPPYTRYHYSRYYHVLETICLRDNPTISKSNLHGGNTISRGIYREDRHQSPFCIKSQAGIAFDTMFKKIHSMGAALVLSYSPYDKTRETSPRILSISELEAIAKKYYKNVDLVSAGQFSHSKLNKSDKNLNVSNDAEILIVCK
ncbi:DNA adenine methylase [Syntrophomonas curvata]